MIRRLFVTGVAAALVLGGPAVAAHAVITACPQSVQGYDTGVNPTYAQVRDRLLTAAAAYDVPYYVLWAVAYQESNWRQYEPDGHVRVSSDGVCGLGIMQVTADSSYSDADKLRLATDWQYNVGEGARIMRAKWDVSQQTPPPTGAAPDDDNVVENWYYAICLYNGCPDNETTYPDRIAEIMSDPFRRIPELAIRSLLRPYPFTTPQQADPSYVFPSAFQARWGALPEDQVFVFYDYQTGNVTSTVPAPTHDVTQVPAIAVAYPFGDYGPDDHKVTCEQCGGWRLAAGLGTQGRAHWTNTVLGSSQSTATWPVATPRTGLYRVSAYVPAIGDDTLGSAVYTVGADTVTLDQNTVKDSWAALGDHALTPGATVVLGDHSTVAGQKVVADAVRAAAVTHLTIGAPHGTVLWGTPVGVNGRLTQVGASDASAGIGGMEIRVWRRRPGTTAWRSGETVLTDAHGYWHTNLAAYENYEYKAGFVRTFADALSTTSGVVRVDARVKVTASLSRTSVPRGVNVTLTTRVLPQHTGQYVYLQRWYSGAWHTSLWKPLGPSGYASFTFSKSVAGTYYYRTYKLADADHAAGWSTVQVLHVG
jgi:hypothetical protein